MSGLRTFENLECWKKCRGLRLFISNTIISNLPGEEKYRLADQILRAARSTTANIAEGYGCFHYLDTAKFCSNVRASAFEVLDHLITACDEGLIENTSHQKGRDAVEETIKFLNEYIHYLRNKARASNEPRF